MDQTIKIYADRDYVDSKGLPDGAGAYQQLVTDANGNAVWEEKPFYKEVATIIPKTTVTENGVVSMYADMKASVSFNVADYKGFVLGETYTVNFYVDDTLQSQDFVAEVSNNTGGPGLIIGAVELVCDDDAEMYALVGSSGALSTMLPVTIEVVQKTIKTIDPEYIPGATFLVEYDGKTGKRITPFQDIIAAINRKLRIGLLGGDGYIYNVSSIEFTEDNEVVLRFLYFIWAGGSTLIVRTTTVPPPYDGEDGEVSYYETTIEMNTGK